MSGFVKHDQDKARFDLLSPEFLSAVARVLTHGAGKYSPDNWKKGFVGGPEAANEARDRYYAALLRHVVDKWAQGEIRDEETGEHHLAHAVCSLMFLAEGDVLAGRLDSLRPPSDKVRGEDLRDLFAKRLGNAERGLK